MALSFDEFKKNLKDGKYESLAGARRAVGKAQAFSAEEKETAKKLVDKHFGSEPQADKKAPAKKAEKKPAVKKEAKVSAKREPKTETKTEKRQPKTAKTTKTSVEFPVVELASEGPVNLEDLSSIGTQIHIAKTACERTTEAIAALKTAGAVAEDGDMQDARTTLAGAIGIFRHLVNQMANKPEAPKARKSKTVIEVAPDSSPVMVPSNGAGSKAEQLFAGSRPDADA